MTRKELRERLYEQWEYSRGKRAKRGVAVLTLIDVRVWRERPNTAVRVSVLDYVGYGFTKVRYPDTWDEEYGLRMAMMKAIAAIVRRMSDDECARIEEALCRPTV